VSGVLVICGPTAAGKSALAMTICRELGGEIVSADSVQVYNGLDIGSAKPTREEQADVRHHLIDIADPVAEQVDAQRWADLADAAIADIWGRGLLPVVCGGTGLYVRALLNGLNPMPDVPDAVKRSVREEMAARGAPAMHEELAKVDPVSAERLAKGDSQRIGRALEVYRASGKPISDWQTGISTDPHPRYPQARVFGLWPDKDALHARIEARVPKMLAAGLVQEVADLVDAGVPTDRGPLLALGYREVVAHLRGDIPEAHLAEAIARGHRRYAKRQLTWFRGIGVREHALEHANVEAIRSMAVTLG